MLSPTEPLPESNRDDNTLWSCDVLDQCYWKKEIPLPGVIEVNAVDGTTHLAELVIN